MQIEINIDSIIRFTPVILLFALMFVAIYVRIGTINIPMVSDYDPHYNFRHALQILNNGLLPPKWDYLSFYPPGRPFPYQLGWEYTLILFYGIMHAINATVTFFNAAMWSNIIVAIMTVIVAFLLGKRLTNNWGGFTAALSVTLAPVLITSTIAGYITKVGMEAFFIVAVPLAILYALEKRTKLSIAIAIITMFAWTFYWEACWYIFLIFVFFIPVYAIYLLINGIKKDSSAPTGTPTKPDWSNLPRHERRANEREWEKNQQSGVGEPKKLSLSISTGKLKELVPIIKILLIIFIVVTVLNLIPHINGLGTMNIYDSLSQSLGFIQQKLIVNISVAELQPIGDILSLSVLQSLIFSRIGIMMILAMIFPFYLLFLLLKKKEIKMSYIFVLTWLGIAFIMMYWGFRFAILFVMPCAAAASIVVGEFFASYKTINPAYSSALIGISLIVLILSIQAAWSFGSISGLDIDQNWIDALNWMKANGNNNTLVETWWDPGHIIADVTGLKAMADGAHCDDASCYPYGHNTRIVDMGNLMTTSNESLSVALLEKYTYLTPAQEQVSKERYPYISQNAFDNITKVYVMATNDLIGKYTWMSYFGGQGHRVAYLDSGIITPGQCGVGDKQNTWVWCPWQMSATNITSDTATYDFQGLQFAVVVRNSTLYPIFQGQYLIEHLVSFDSSGNAQVTDLSNASVGLTKLDGMFWVSSNFQNAYYFSPEVYQSTFFKLFFLNGKGAPEFIPVFSNSEVKVYELNMTNMLPSPFTTIPSYITSSSA